MALHESGQMYLEAIYVLLQNNEKIRSIDICSYLGYTKPSVSRAIGILKKEEYRAWRKTHLPDWEIMAEQLMVYFLSTYFCGAVYDEYVASKVKLSVLSVFYLDEILTAQWLQQKKTLDFCDVVRVTYRFSRELEHSDENLCEMDRMLEEL